MMPLVELRWLLKKCASRETSAGPDQWSEDNPLFGHCAVAATIVQDFLGGKIVSRFFPAEWAEKFKDRSHYWNVFLNGEVVDFSREQFPPDFPLDDLTSGKIGYPRGDDDKREYLLSVAATKQRYEMLRNRIEEYLKAQPILLNEKFMRCWELAFSSPAKCPKMRFACLVFDGERLIAEDVNRLMSEKFGKERLCSLDGTQCVRMNVEHRLDPSLGDCGHAPIWCLKKVFDLGYRPSDLQRLDFYEAGFYLDGSPWFRSKAEYTCIACENAFAIFGLDKIWSVCDGRWKKLLTRDSFFGAAEYATSKRKV